VINTELNSNWLSEQSERNGENLAIVSNQVKLTYTQLHKKVKERAASLSKTVNKNNIIGIPVKHSYKFIIDLFALWDLGAIVLPLNSKLKQSEIDRQIDFIGCRVISNLEVTETELFIAPKYDRDKIALIMFTSGSTGEQKAVQHTFKSLYSSAQSIDNAILFKSGEKWLVSLPFYRIGGFQIILRAILSGGTLCIPKSVRLTDLAEDVSLYQPHYLSLVNASLKRLLESEYVDLRKSKAIFIGGGPVDSNLLKKGIDKGLPLYKVYGSTETGSMVSMLSPAKISDKIESAGKPLEAVIIKLIDKEIYVQSNSLFIGYYKNKILTEEKFKNGFYLTGDLGYFDEDGFLYVRNRKDNLIISGGEKIDPKEIENKLNSFENISNAIVFGIPDKKWGEKVCAIFIGKTKLEIPKIKDYLEQKLPSYKIPKEIKQVDHFPVDEMGKLNRDELLELFR